MTGIRISSQLLKRKVYGASIRGVFAQICIPHPGRMGQLAKICNGEPPGSGKGLWRERIAKICAPPKSYYPRMEMGNTVWAE